MIPSRIDDAPMPVRGPGAAGSLATGDDAPAVGTTFADWLNRLPESPRAAQQAAKLFNEDGFFGEAGRGVGSARPIGGMESGGKADAGMSSASPLPLSSPIAPSSEPMTEAVAADPAPEPAAPPGGSHAPGGGSASPGTALPQPSHHGGVATMVMPLSLTLPPPAPIATPSPMRMPVSESAAATPPLPLRHAGMGAASPVAVAIRAVEHGLEVVARLDRLNEEERVAIADAIAALLASHGFAPGHIAVLAPAPVR